MKSSMTQASPRVMFINQARFHPVYFVTGQVMAIKNQNIST